MIKKKSIHFRLFETFNSKKLSANEENTKYTVGTSSQIIEGTPDVPYYAIVFIKDTHQIWTHGELYDFALKTQLQAKANASTLGAHTSNTNNPHSVTKAQVGLGNVDNTSDLDKPISNEVKQVIEEVEKVTASALVELHNAMLENKKVTASSLNELQQRIIALENK